MSKLLLFITLLTLSLPVIGQIGWTYYFERKSDDTYTCHVMLTPDSQGKLRKARIKFLPSTYLDYKNEKFESFDGMWVNKFKIREGQTPFIIKIRIRYNWKRRVYEDIINAGKWPGEKKIKNT